jgi:hypothetical protein
MIRFLAIWNIIITITLILVLKTVFDARASAASLESAQIIRTTRLEILDKSGKVRAILAGDDEYSTPKFSLLNSDGRPAALIMVNQLGYGTLYFQSKDVEGKVSVGYQWGSDSFPQNQEDPLASWGVRVRGANGDVVTSFGVGNGGQILEPRKSK